MKESSQIAVGRGPRTTPPPVSKPPIDPPTGKSGRRQTPEQGMMGMTEEELTKFMADNAAAIKEAAQAAIIEKIQSTIKWHLPDSVQETINKFFKEEIVPEVTKYLADQKGPILEAAKVSAAALSDELAKKMFETCIKNMDSYKAEEVFKALLGVKSRY